MKNQIVICIKNAKLKSVFDDNGKQCFTKGKEYTFVDNKNVIDDLGTKHDISFFDDRVWFDRYFKLK